MIKEFIKRNNDLLVWINIRADQNWISEADRAFIETQLKALDSKYVDVVGGAKRNTIIFKNHFRIFKILEQK